MVDADDGLAEVRRSYEHATLTLDDLSDEERASPLLAVGRWLDEARADGRDPEPTAMVLATVTTGGDGPDARVVLCKGLDADGLVFYTNHGSAKGRQLDATPQAAVVFHWAALERQVRLRGRVTPVDDATSDRYFASRPRGSRIGAWASDQSRPIDTRDDLETQAAAAEDRFADGDVPRPDDWGGYVLRPTEIELWQGRPSRLHDRLHATHDGNDWTWARLQP